VNEMKVARLILAYNGAAVPARALQIEIHWGGYAMMQAELKLLATARAAGPLR
jgi:hypothetical protein